MAAQTFEDGLLDKFRNWFDCQEIEAFQSKNDKHPGRTYYGFPGVFLCWADECGANMPVHRVRSALATIRKYRAELSEAEQICKQMQ